MVHAGQLEQDSGIKPRCVTDWRPSPRSTFLFRGHHNGMHLESISGFKGISLTSPFVLFSVRQAAVTLSCADSSFDSNSLFSFSTFCFSSYSSSSWTSICFSWAHIQNNTNEKGGGGMGWGGVSSTHACSSMIINFKANV